MSTDEVGAYIRLLCHQWNRGSIPVKPNRQQRLAGGSVSGAVLAKFKLGRDGLLRNERLEFERQKQSKFRESQRQKGILSGQSRRTPVEPRLNPGLTRVEPRAVGTQLNSPSPSPSPVSLFPPIAPPTEGPKINGVRDPIMQRAAKIFHRRETTPFTAAEQRAFRNNWLAILDTTEEDWQMLENHYALPQPQTLTRKDLATLVNNWNGELDRARKYKPKPQARTHAP